MTPGGFPADSMGMRLVPGSAAPPVGGVGRARVVGAILLAALVPRAEAAETRLLRNPHTPLPKGPPPVVGAVISHLGDGSFLVAGGLDPRKRPMREAFVFTPDPFERPAESIRKGLGGSWKRAGPMRFPRAWASAGLMADGRVVVAGGFGADGQPTRTAEIYDPRRGTFHRVRDLHTARAGAAVVRVLNHRLVFFGGYRRRGVPTATIETFDPAHLEFDAHPWRLPEPVAFPAAVRLEDGDVLVSGGWNSRRASDVICLFDDRGGGHAPRAGSPRHEFSPGSLRMAGPLAGPRAGHRMRRLGEVVLIVGGVHGEPCTSTEPADPPEVWDPARPGPISAFEFSLRRRGETAFTPDDRLPLAFPHPGGQRAVVRRHLPDCRPPPAPPPEVVSTFCWVFPRDTRWPFDLPRGHREHPVRLEPRDRSWPWGPLPRDPRPLCPAPGWPDLVERKE